MGRSSNAVKENNQDVTTEQVIQYFSTNNLSISLGLSDEEKLVIFLKTRELNNQQVAQLRKQQLNANLSQSFETEYGGHKL